MVFRGTFDYSLDAKNRLTLPAKFRAQLSGDLTLSRGTDRCVTIQTAEDFDAFLDASVEDLHPLSNQRRKLERYFSGGAFQTTLDSAGRVQIPNRLLEHAGLQKDVVVVGVKDTLEVWDRDAWAQQDDETDIQQLTARFDNPD